MSETGALLRAVTFPVTPLLPHRPGIAVSPEIRVRLISHLRTKGITPSSVEDYLACPKLFLYRRVLRLSTMNEVAEDGDRALFGEIVHRVLREFFTPHLGALVSSADFDPDSLRDALERELDNCAFSLQLPYDARVALIASARERLARFLANMPSTTVVELEHEAERLLTVEDPDAGDLVVTLRGAMDRVDLRGEGHTVLDYKTGTVQAQGGAPWLDAELFGRIAQALPGSVEAEALLDEISELGLDAQLPLYLYLLDGLGGYHPHNAAWVELKKSGEEKPLFAEAVEAEDRQAVVQERVPALLQFILRHLLACAVLPARQGRRCDWCDYKGPCVA